MPHVPATEITPSDKLTTSGTSKRPAILLFVFRAPREFDSMKKSISKARTTALLPLAHQKSVR